MSPNPMARASFAILTVVLAAAPPAVSAASDGDGKTYCLYQSELPDGSVYFWNATDGNNALTFSQRDLGEYKTGKIDWLSSNRGTIVESNAPVIVFEDAKGQRYVDTRGASVKWTIGPMNPPPPANTPYPSFYPQGPAWAIASTIDSWVDGRGFVHSVSVIQRQLLFNAWIRESGFSGVNRVAVNGIIDRPTLWAESTKQHSILDKAQRGIRKDCLDAAAGKFSCDAAPWPNDAVQVAEESLGAAREALARYDAELSAVRLAAPASKPTMCDYPPVIAYAPEIKDDAKKSFDVYLDRTIFRGVVNDGVSEALDPGSFNAGTARNLMQLEGEARRRVQEAAAYAPAERN